MRADKEKFQPFVREGWARRRDVLGFGGDLEERLGVFPNFCVARRIGQTVARGVKQPCLRFFRHAIERPAAQCGAESIAERVLRARDVS